MDANPLTPEYSRYSQFDKLAEQSRDRVKEIVTGLAATNPEPGTVAFKVSTIYQQAMDSVRRNAEGAAPIQADLKRIENAKPEEMEDLFLWMHGNFASPFFSAGPQADLADSNAYAMYVGGGGTTLGDRDYYLSDDKENVKVREAYKKLIEKEMRLAGYSKKDARRIVNNVMKSRQRSPTPPGPAKRAATCPPCIILARSHSFRKCIPTFLGTVSSSRPWTSRPLTRLS